ncbi:hypothetical protein CFP65_0882 [Kitasatospora sp. MMS16-BH015]|uniref:hypothetical protein n=1 Tax=Kitasatospora sp. MMS16-BH015 TaxID=2018025 RepID=UPI000CA1234A|nr:hypothetical protein [Kitasatospora sp. MMS16-BH015]AUG75806.1 hypothetical protein CFP65_0882 [Kitasatospora sp. MMS16-BH015]
MTPVSLHLEYITDPGHHGDLLLRLGVYRHHCDSYYLALDESREAGDDLVTSLTRLLGQWVTQLRGLTKGGGAVLLPYDFSDQCTAWLQVSSVDGDRAAVQAGWSLVEGWRIQPSNYATTAPEITDFDPIVNARIECSLEDLISTVERNRDAFASA